MCVFKFRVPDNSIFYAKFFILDYYLMTVLNPSVDFVKYKSFTTEFLSFMSYKLEERYYMLYINQLENVIDADLWRYQVHIQEVTTEFTEDPFHLDLRDFYPDIDYIMDNKIMIQMCFKSQAYNKLVCTVHSNVAAELLTWSFPNLTKDARYTRRINVCFKATSFPLPHAQARTRTHTRGPACSHTHTKLKN